MSRYQLRRDGGGRRWIGRYGVEHGGGWGFAAGGEVVLAPTEYERGIGRVGGNHVSVWDALGFFQQKMGRACLKFGESTNFAPLLNFGPTVGQG